jgi:2-oxoisovalerate dehydrogenase E2 component (dihydrolipoyl transacylase)
VITDKLVAKIPSAYSGKVSKLNFKSDDICQVGEVLLEMEVGDNIEVKGSTTEAEHKAEEPPKGEAVKQEVPREEPKKEESRASGGKILTTPAVRGLAAEMKIDLAKVTPTGKGGRITKNDVLKYAESEKSKESAKPSAKQTIPQAAPVVALEQDRVVKLTGVRKAMAKSMTDALTIPPYNLQEEMCIEKIKKMKADYVKANPKMKMTYLPFFLKAFSQAMLKYPIFNAVSNPIPDKEGYITEYIEKAEHNISIAIDAPSGLLVPNIKSVQRKSILEINEEVRALIERGRTDSLTKEDLSDGTFTLSSIGGVGGLIGAPVIFRPQVAIAAMCKIRTVGSYVKKEDGKMELKPMEIIGVSLSCDHRIIDGATGARFITVVKDYIENIDTLLLSLK